MPIVEDTTSRGWGHRLFSEVLQDDAQAIPLIYTGEGEESDEEFEWHMDKSKLEEASTSKWPCITIPPEEGIRW